MHTDRLQPPKSHPGHNPHWAKVTDEEKADADWHYVGYPGLARWMASSNDFFILRKFSTATARTLLYLQYEISRREKALEGWDQWTMRFPAEATTLGSFDIDRDSPRAKIIGELRDLLKEYYDLINAFSAVRSKPFAQNYHRANLQSWFNYYPGAIHEGENHYKDPKDSDKVRGDDLFPVLPPHTRTPLGWILSHLGAVRRLFRHDQLRADRIHADGVEYHSDTALEVATSGAIIFLGLAFLFGPMWWLNYVYDNTQRLGIITGFVACFTLLLWAAAGPRGFEVLAGAAAYAAVLAVFLQIQNPQAPSG